ncbi:protein FAM227A-like isoform X1 [Hypanus sabinus]|uniref:protein FAM227A-like isoform X1 n=1 Tax=Hypanus sabinus TaxID=79690 RepID=UPI0028C38120|nr:protein FAM227A-like isoform X1 [Hypanus sabinus]
MGEGGKIDTGSRGTMVEINCRLTHLEIFEEDLNVPLDVAAQQKQTLQRNLERAPAPFVIGSINQVNEKLQHLSGTFLAHPAALLVETRARDGAFPPRIRPEKTVQDFLEVQEEKKTKSKHSDEKPKLLELQHYPGFSALQPTPLPNETSLDQILDNVLKARGHLKKQTGYIAEFRQMLSSTVVQDILLDSFWWFFLREQKTHSSVQCRLFDRISKNYVQLIMKSWSWSFGDRFLQEFPSTLSQAVYTSFCCSFPQSWIQFHNNDFKAKVCDVVYRWFGGIRPTPKIFKNWNCDALLSQEVKDAMSRTAQDGEQNKKGIKKILFNLNQSSGLGPLTATSKSKRPTSMSLKVSNKLSTERKENILSRLPLDSPSKPKSLESQQESITDLLETETCQRDERPARSPDAVSSVSREIVRSSGMSHLPLQKEILPGLLRSSSVCVYCFGFPASSDFLVSVSPLTMLPKLLHHNNESVKFPTSVKPTDPAADDIPQVYLSTYSPNLSVLYPVPEQ